MFVFKLSWLPWMILVAGVVMIVYGDGSDTSVVMGFALIIGGAIWCYYAYGKKNKPTSSSPQNVQHSTNTATQAPTSTPITKETVSNSNVCESCGNTLTQGMIFCDKCGKRILPR